MPPQRTNEAQEWQRKLARIVVRTEGRKKAREASSWREVVDAMKSLQDSEKLSELLDKLIHSELVIDEKRAKLAEELSVELHRIRPDLQNAAVILLGSSVHGGSIVRDLLGNNEDTDLDWGIAADNLDLKDPNFRNQVHSEMKPVVQQLGQAAGFDPDFSSCIAYNPEQIYICNFQSPQEAIKLMRTELGNSYDAVDNADPLVVAFLPSYPAEVNIRNRQMVLEGLRELGKVNEDHWKRIVSKLINAWKDIHTLKTKYFGYHSQSLDPRSNELRRQVLQNPEKFMIEPFRLLLESTRS